MKNPFQHIVIVILAMHQLDIYAVQQNKMFKKKSTDIISIEGLNTEYAKQKVHD